MGPRGHSQQIHRSERFDYFYANLPHLPMENRKNDFWIRLKNAKFREILAIGLRVS